MPDTHGLLKIPLKFMEYINKVGDNKNTLTHILFTSSIDGGAGPGLLGYIFLTLVRIKDLQIQLQSLSNNISKSLQDRISKIEIVYLNKIKNLIYKELRNNISINSKFHIDINDLTYNILRLSPDKGVDVIEVKKELDEYIELYYNYISSLNKENLNKPLYKILKLEARLLFISLWFTLISLLRYGLLTSITKLSPDIERKMLNEYSEILWEMIFRIGNVMGYKSEWVLSSLHFYLDIYSDSPITTKIIKRGEHEEWICIAGDCWLSKYAPIISRVISSELKDLLRLPALFMKSFWRYLYINILGYDDNDIQVYIGYSRKYCKVRILFSHKITSGVERSSQ